MKTIFKNFQLLLLLFLIFIYSCSDGPTGPESPYYNWPLSSPEEQGINSLLLNQAFSQGELKGFVDCILVIRNGYLVGERYYNGYGREVAHNVKSVSKSFLSALTGIALRDGDLSSTSLKMLDFFPEYVYQSIDPRKYNITVRDLLMMRGGIDSDRNIYSSIYNSTNWIRTTIQMPLVYNPGTTFCYNTFLTHLLSAIITKATGKSTLDYFKEKLFAQIGVNCAQWQQCPQGYYFGGNNMYFTPRDMARLGYLYLNGGVMDGRQVIPANWVQESLTNYTQFSSSTWGDLQDVNYGYLWWLGKIKNHPVFLAIGYGGQFVINFTDLNMIVVTTANNQVDWNIADEHERAILKIVADYIVSAVGN